MLLARRLTAIHARAPLTRRCSGSAALAHAKLREELEAVKQRIKKLEAENPELVDGLEESMRSLRASNPDLRSNHNAADPFSPPKLHHINIVHAKGSELLVDFYRDVMRMDEMPVDLFPRNAAAAAGGSDVPIGFTTDGHMQMHPRHRTSASPFEAARSSTRLVLARSATLPSAPTTLTRSRSISRRAASRTPIMARDLRAIGIRYSSSTRRGPS